MNEKSDLPKVSVVMLCWNRIGDVRQSLLKISEIDYPNLEVIVCDNCSSDGTQEMIRSEFQNVKLIEMDENIGIAAYNAGFEAAEGEYIIIIDDDSFPAKDSVGRMVEKFQQDPKLGICAFDVRSFSGYDSVSEEVPQENTAAESKEYYMGFNGAGAGVRKELFKKIGYYPGEFFLYMNEADCAVRVWNEGYKVIFFSDLISYHKQAAKNRTSWRAPFFYTRNSFWLAWKNYPLPKALAVTLKLIYNCFYYSLEQGTVIYLKAMCDAFLSLGKLKGKRAPVRCEIADKMRIPLNLPFTFYG